MRGNLAWGIAIAILAVASAWPVARSYVVETTVPAAQACPSPDHWNLSSASPTQLQWSTSLASEQQILTIAPLGSPAQLTEIQSVIQTALNAWTGVDSTSANPNYVPGVVGAIGTTSTADACTADDGSGADGVNMRVCPPPIDWFMDEALSLMLTLWLAESLDLRVTGTPDMRPKTCGSKTHPF